jgi:small subunit ribosomal protein S17
MAKSFTGVVKSHKTDKTIVVIVHTSKTHPLYRKQYSDSKNFMAHDEQNEAQVGDRVLIAECRPLSAHKHHKLERILEKAAIQHEEPTLEVLQKDDKEAAS